MKFAWRKCVLIAFAVLSCFFLRSSLVLAEPTCDPINVRKILIERLRDCPHKMLSLKIGYNPGGNTYTLGTHFMSYLSRVAGEDPAFGAMVEPKPGASGEIASRHVAELDSDASNCELLVAQSNQLTTNAIGLSNAVDPDVDLIPIAQLGEAPLVLTVNPKMTPYTSLKSFVSYLTSRRLPNRNRKDFFGSNGLYTTDHVATEVLLGAIGAKGTHVPFTGSGPLIQNLMATTPGQVNFALLSLGLIKEQLAEGKLLGLGIAALKDLHIARSGRPDLVIPSIARMVPKLQKASVWVALVGGRNMSPEFGDAMAEVAACFAEDGEARSILVDKMNFTLGGSRDQVLQRMKTETAAARKVYIR